MENEPEREIKYFAQGYVASGASLVAQMVKNLLAMQETWVQSLSHRGPLEKRMANHSKRHRYDHNLEAGWKFK